MQFGTLKAVLWDMDGVIVSTTQVHIEAWKSVLSEHRLPYDPQKFNQIFGLKNSEFILRLVNVPLDEPTRKLLVDQKEDHFKRLGRQIIALPGVLMWLEQFKTWGCKQAIASSGEAGNVEFIVDALGIRDYFDALVTPGILPGKPDPAVFIKASRLLDTHAESCLVIEDSMPGIEAARRAGIRCIAVGSTHPLHLLAQADLVVDSLDQLTSEQLVAVFQ